MRRLKKPSLHLLSKEIILSVVLITLTYSGIYAQASGEPAPTAPQNDVQRRLDRARALGASHKLEAAAKELESIRASSVDDVVHHVTAVMLIGIYVEEGHYGRAESLLDETFRMQAKKEGVPRYFALAGQAVNSVRFHLQRYRNFGIKIADAGLPKEALQDLNRVSSLLERMVVQAKALAGNNIRSYDAAALLEDLSAIRLSLARNIEERAKWENEHLAARNALASSHTKIASISGIPQISPASEVQRKPGQSNDSAVETRGPSTNPETAGAEEGKEEPRTFSTGGSLNQRASKRVVPTYPPLAKSGGMSGVVKVFVIVDVDGKVSEISRSEGPAVLKQAAEDAARGWRFPPTVVSGKPVRLSGYIEFNFTL